MCYFHKFHKVVRSDLPENSFLFAEVSYFEQIRMLEGDLTESIGRAIWFRASREPISCFPKILVVLFNKRTGSIKVDHVGIARGQARLIEAVKVCTRLRAPYILDPWG